MMKARILGFMVVFAIVVATSACGGDGGLIGPPDGVGTDGDDDLICSVNPDLLFSNLPPEGIPALTEPAMVAADDPDAAYLFDFDRVLGVVIDGNARAYPHNILWHHEIINDRVGDTWFTVTFCPLTGSGLVFDPFVDGDRLELGVSGLLFANNLVLYDRISGDVYGPQLSVEGKCGVYQDRSIELLNVQEMSWGRGSQLHPHTTVVSRETGVVRNYRQYPYGSYDEIDNGDLLYSMNVDRSRPLKERVLAIRMDEGGGRGYPFGSLRELGATSVVNEVVDGVPTVVFWFAWRHFQPAGVTFRQ